MTAPAREWVLNDDGSYDLVGLRRGFEARIFPAPLHEWRVEILAPGPAGSLSRYAQATRHRQLSPAYAWAEWRIAQLNGFEPAPGSNSGATGVATPDPGR